MIDPYEDPRGAVMEACREMAEAFYAKGENDDDPEGDLLPTCVLWVEYDADPYGINSEHGLKVIGFDPAMMQDKDNFFGAILPAAIKMNEGVKAAAFMSPVWTMKMPRFSFEATPDQLRVLQGESMENMDGRREAITVAGIDEEGEVDLVMADIQRHPMGLGEWRDEQVGMEGRAIDGLKMGMGVAQDLPPHLHELFETIMKHIGYEDGEEYWEAFQEADDKLEFLEETKKKMAAIPSHQRSKIMEGVALNMIQNHTFSAN